MRVLVQIIAGKLAHFDETLVLPGGDGHRHRARVAGVIYAAAIGLVYSTGTIFKRLVSCVSLHTSTMESLTEDVDVLFMMLCREKPSAAGLKRLRMLSLVAHSWHAVAQRVRMHVPWMAPYIACADTFALTVPDLTPAQVLSGLRSFPACPRTQLACVQALESHCWHGSDREDMSAFEVQHMLACEWVLDCVVAVMRAGVVSIRGLPSTAPSDTVDVQTACIQFLHSLICPFGGDKLESCIMDMASRAGVFATVAHVIYVNRERCEGTSMHMDGLELLLHGAGEPASVLRAAPADAKTTVVAAATAVMRSHICPSHCKAWVVGMDVVRLRLEQPCPSECRTEALGIALDALRRRSPCSFGMHAPGRAHMAERYATFHQHACAALSLLACDANYARSIATAGGISLLVALMRDTTDAKTVEACCLVLGFVGWSDETLQQRIIADDGVSALQHAVRSMPKGVCREHALRVLHKLLRRAEACACAGVY